MNTTLSSESGSSGMRLGFKLMVIFLVIGFLMIPLFMIGRVADERKDRALAVGEEIIAMNGGRSAIIGPLLMVPITVQARNSDNRLVSVRHVAVIVPENLNISGTVRTETRRRGIYEVPVYTADLQLSADFSAVRSKLAANLVGVNYSADWESAWYSLEMLDKRSLKSAPLLTVNGLAGASMKGRESSFEWSASALTFPASSISPAHLEISVSLGGGGDLAVYPLGENVSCTLKSDWLSPSFKGYVLPASYTITEAGFEAQWFIPDTARPYPGAFIAESDYNSLQRYSFAVDFFQPVSVYHKTERALKYGLLFIIVPFIVFFLFEIFLKRRIHPLQYTMIGMADVFFYLLLLSVSEHLPFMAAYAIGALAVCLLVSFYSAAILGSALRGLVMSPVLGGIYLYLYVALESEDYALLVGAIGVFTILAAVMILTRNIDWYRISEIRAAPSDAAGDKER